MNERLRLIRKQSGLNQQGMAEKLSISQTHVSALENGVKNLTDRLIADYCREFSINEEWLRTGEGEMFEQAKTFSLDEKARQYSLTDLELEIMRNYMELDVSIRSSIVEMVKKSVSAVEDKEDLDIEKEVSSYEQELKAAKKAKEKSSASDITNAPSGKENA